MVSSVHVEPDLLHQITDSGNPAVWHVTVNGARPLIGVSGARSYVERPVRRPSDSYRGDTGMVGLLVRSHKP